MKNIFSLDEIKLLLCTQNISDESSQKVISSLKELGTIDKSAVILSCLVNNISVTKTLKIDSFL